MPPSTVLVVDDFEPIRRIVCSILEASDDFRVVGQAIDGLDGVQQAETLQPDVVLLDITLPKLNGIAAARRIRDVAPASKIVFLTQHTGVEIAEHALSTGATGYVIKLDARSELLEALASVLQGRPFVSRRLSGLLALARGKESVHVHEARFCRDRAQVLQSFGDFIEDALRAGNAAIFVAAAPLRDRIPEELQRRGVDVGSALGQGRYIPLDVDDVLSGFMIGGSPDPLRFSTQVRDLLARAASAATGNPRRVAACGEIAPALLARGEVEAAIRVEQLWDGAARTYGVRILCVYMPSADRDRDDQEILQRIRAEHTAVHST